MHYDLKVPFDKKDIEKLNAGDSVTLCGKILTGRDAAHKRLFECIRNGNKPPVDLSGQAIYYVGPCRKDGVIVSAGPTTSMRMDAYAPTLYDEGVFATIGKGDRSKQVYDAIVRNKCVYLAVIGGAGALYAKCIKDAKVLAYDDLGTEAIYEFDVENFDCIVAIDCNGETIYKN